MLSSFMADQCWRNKMFSSDHKTAYLFFNVSHLPTAGLFLLVLFHFLTQVKILLTWFLLILTALEFSSQARTSSYSVLGAIAALRRFLPPDVPCPKQATFSPNHSLKASCSGCTSSTSPGVGKQFSLQGGSSRLFFPALSLSSSVCPPSVLLV